MKKETKKLMKQVCFDVIIVGIITISFAYILNYHIFHEEVSGIVTDIEFNGLDMTFVVENNTNTERFTIKIYESGTPFYQYYGRNCTFKREHNLCGTWSELSLSIDTTISMDDWNERAKTFS